MKLWYNSIHEEADSILSFLSNGGIVPKGRRSIRGGTRSRMDAYTLRHKVPRADTRRHTLLAACRMHCRRSHGIPGYTRHTCFCQTTHRFHRLRPTVRAAQCLDADSGCFGRGERSGLRALKAQPKVMRLRRMAGQPVLERDTRRCIHTGNEFARHRSSDVSYRQKARRPQLRSHGDS